MPQYRLRHRISRAQEDLLSAIANGVDALVSFQEDWSRLVDDIDQEARLRTIDEATMSMAVTTASIVSTLSKSFLDLDNTANDTRSVFRDKVQGILQDVNSTFPLKKHHSMPFQSAYQWLTDNLHNPYPSSSVKQELADSSDASLESINEWFHNARERIGWTTLARHHFQGSRSAIVDAAWRAFVEPDSRRPLPPNLQRAFSIVKDNLVNLRSDTSSHKAVDQARVEGLSSDHGGAEVRDDLTGELRHGALKDCRADLDRDPHTARSSPNSRTLHLLELDQAEEEEEDMTPPPPIAGCKRRADTDLEACDSSHSPKEIRYRSPKRQRSEPPSTSNQVYSSPVLTPVLTPTATGVQASNVESTLPLLIHSTPSCTSILPNDPFITASPALLSSQTTQSPSQPLAAVPNSRKRRLSDASCDIIPKRPRHIRDSHRMQIVSNPFPLGPNEIAQDTTLSESWCQNVTSAACKPFGSDLSSDGSPATSVLNTPWTDGLLVLPNDFMVPSQQVDLSDEDFKAMLASGYNISSSFIPADQGLFEMLPSLDDLFPPSLSGLQTPLIEQPAQYIIDLGLQTVGTSQIEEYKAQSSSIPTSLSYDDPHQILLPPLEGIVNPISDTLTQYTSLCNIGEDTLDNWTAGLLGWRDINLSAQM
uniref:B1 homeodomain mating type protein n=1 Tax=Heterobasidion abietinum TaxID=207833 RepID=S5RWG4_9AGAM|nr:b1 homeodomain mating type protein [Heterobasidion abietinum]